MTKRTTILAAVAAASLLAATPAVAGESESAASSAGATASYIIQFTPGSDRASEVAKARRLGMTVTFEYTTALKGMAVEATAGQLRALQANPNVQLVEADGIATISATQVDPTWGLDRIDQRALPLSSTYAYTSTGAGVRAYVIDTGIEAGHTEFTGRMAGGFDAVTPGGTADDCNGHGTHVAGTIGGTKYGVAKEVTLVPVRVLGCNGSGAWSEVIAGVDWVAADAQGKGPAVANMSLGGGLTTSLNDAVAAAITKGVTFAVAAGNENANACTRSPASTPEALTVGATTATDARASYSNYGSCLDIFAPGSNITSAWHTGTTATNTISGTSMAAPHVAGAAALFLAVNRDASPTTLAGALTGSATSGKVSSPGTDSPNRLLFVGAETLPATPTISSLSPDSGAPGTTVTINGEHLAGATGVAFGGTSAIFLPISGTQVTATVPNIAAGSSPVTVTTPGGTSSSLAFTVGPAPVSTLPGAPTIGTATAGSRSATVTWTAPTDTGNSAITSYRVTAYHSNGKVAKTVTGIGPSATSTIITGLKSRASYFFKVAAVNANGPSELSKPSNTVTVR